MTPELITVAAWAIGAVFAVGALLALVRVVRGPSIVDRMAGSDTLLTILICVLVTEMAINRHTTTLPLVIALAMTASIGTLSVARFVSRGRRSHHDER